MAHFIAIVALQILSASCISVTHSLQPLMLKVSRPVNFTWTEGTMRFKVRIAICLSFLQLLQSLAGSTKACKLLCPSCLQKTCACWCPEFGRYWKHFQSVCPTQPSVLQMTKCTLQFHYEFGKSTIILGLCCRVYLMVWGTTAHSVSHDAHWNFTSCPLLAKRHWNMFWFCDQRYGR